ncbi:MAG: PhoH family protein [Candidatus Babeliales bacterium]
MLLFDPTLEFVALLGPAGTGKTFLALLAGLHQVMVEDLYQKLLVSRPVVPLGPDIGYLPGGLQRKCSHGCSLFMTTLMFYYTQVIIKSIFNK